MRIFVFSVMTLSSTCSDCGSAPYNPGSGPGPQHPPSSSCDLDDLLAEVDGFNVVTLGDYVAGHSDVEGTLAVGGDLEVEHYSVGLTDPGGVAAVVDGTAWIAHASVHGDLVWGDGAHLTSVGFPTGGSSYSGSLLNFAFAQADLEDLTHGISALYANGDTEVSAWDEITFDGDDPIRNVFRISAGQLSDAASVTLDVPGSSTVIIDITGTNVRIADFGFFLNGHMTQRILFNAANAQTVRMDAIALQGSLVAPYASVDFDNGQMNGQLFVEQFAGDSFDDGQPDGQLNDRPFIGQLCY